MSKLRFADKGTAYLPIVVSADAPQEIKTSARDMAHILWRMTGAKFELAETAYSPAIPASRKT